MATVSKPLHGFARTLWNKLIIAKCSMTTFQLASKEQPEGCETN